MTFTNTDGVTYSFYSEVFVHIENKICHNTDYFVQDIILQELLDFVVCDPRKKTRASF